MIKAEVERQFILKHDVTLDASRVGSLEFEHDEGMVIAVLDFFNAEDANHLSVAPFLNRAKAFVRQVDMNVVVRAAQNLVFLGLCEPIILNLVIVFLLYTWDKIAWTMMGLSHLSLTRVIWSAVQSSAPHHCLSLCTPAGWGHHLELIVGIEHLYFENTQFL